VSPAGALSIGLWQHGAALSLAVLDIVSRGKRSVALLPVRMGRAMMINCCGDAVAAVTPARLGGDPSRFIWFTRSGQDGPAVVAAFAIESVLNTVFMVGSALLISVFFAPAIWDFSMRLMVGAGTGRRALFWSIGIAVIVLVLIALRRWAAGLATRLKTFILESWHDFLAEPRAAVAIASVWTVVSMVARAAILPVLLARATGIATQALILGSVQAFYILLLSPTPSGVGLVEGGFFAAFGHAVSVGDLAKLVFVWRAYSWFCAGGVGAILLFREWSRRKTFS
jgi:uncharacterized membrane protein YbhN (UPF0104 family)